MISMNSYISIAYGDPMNKFELSTMSIIKFIAVIVGFYLLYTLREIAVLLFIVMIIVTALEPIVSWAEERKIPRVLSAIIIYSLVISLLSLIVYLIIPPIVLEIKNFAYTLPSYTSQFNVIYNFVIESSAKWQGSIETISKELSQLTGGVYNSTVAIFGGVASALTVLILSFYSLVDKKGLNKFLLSFVPQKNQNLITDLTNKISNKLGKWLRGQIAISIIMTAVVFIFLTIAKIPFALTIGVIGGLLEIVPIIGAVVTGTLAVGVALIYTTWIKALIILIIFIAIQQFETNYIVPKIMSKAVGLYPAVIIVAMLIGATLGGIFGAILAIPLTTTLIVTIQEFQNNRG
ncbi:MAG: hypothetical protein ACD_58C00097G0001 [uncultured bacterium]|nr:MAG: hypothetical protein ACD_58C00097G0001 [uncultured bacterium]